MKNMKKILPILLTSIISFSSFSQNLPQGIAYQAVAVKEGPYSVAGKNPQAIYWSNKDIKVRFTILDQYPNPMDTYQEFHSVSTDDYGVFNLIIGQGTVISGDFETIPWELGTAHLQVEIDFDNDDNFKVTSFERFWSVPYAFVSKKDDSTNNDSAIQALNDKINTLKANDLDTVLGNEIQTLTIKGDSLSISDGNTVKIDFPANLDNDTTNEIQTISLSNDTIHLSKGGGKVGLDLIRSYIDSTIRSYNSSSNFSGSIVNSGDGSFCLNGTLVNLNTWAKNKGILKININDVMTDSIVLINDKYIHNIKLNKIIELPLNSGNQLQFNDSVIYIQRQVSNQQSKIAVYKINNSFNLDSVTSVNLPATSLSNWSQSDRISEGVVNKSNDLIWCSLAQTGLYNIRKFDYSSKSLQSNSTTGYNYVKLVSGDSVIISNMLINTNTMIPYGNIPGQFLSGNYAKSAAFFNGKIISGGDWGVLEYDLSSGIIDTLLLKNAWEFNKTNIVRFHFDILGKHNGKLWVSVRQEMNGTGGVGRNHLYPRTYFFKNLVLDTKGENIISISPDGFAQLETKFKYMLDGGVDSLLSASDIGFQTGIVNNSRNRLSFPIKIEHILFNDHFLPIGPPCLNNNINPFSRGLWYFYSKN